MGSSGLNFPESRENTISWVIQIFNYECGPNSQKVSLLSSCGTLHPDPISLQVVVFTDPNSANSKPSHLALNTALFQGDAQPLRHSKDRRLGKSRYLFPGKRASMKVLKIQTYDRPWRATETFFQANMLCYELSSPLKIFSVKFEQILLEPTGMCCCLNLKTNNSAPQPGASPSHHSPV